MVQAFDSAFAERFGEQSKTMKILDAGAGTGMVGEELLKLGYTNIDALDYCQEMLDVAKEKKIYKKMICAALCEEPVIEISTGEYDGVISCGTFVVGAARAVGLREVVRHIKSGKYVPLHFYILCKWHNKTVVIG